MRISCTIILITLLSITKTYAQDSHNHHHERNEIGLSGGAIYGIDDKTWGTGIHLHYYRTLDDHSKWSVGAFAEQAWLEGNHFSVGAGVKFSPISRLHLGVLPGVTFAKHEHEHNGDVHDDGWKSDFSAHFELVYDLFHWGKFHVGPAFDYSWSKDDSHFMLGIHAAIGF